MFAVFESPELQGLHSAVNCEEPRVGNIWHVYQPFTLVINSKKLRRKIEHVETVILQQFSVAHAWEP